MTEYWPCLLAAVCAIAVLRCAARQRHGMRSLLAGAVCGLGALASELCAMEYSLFTLTKKQPWTSWKKYLQHSKAAQALIVYEERYG